MRNQVGSPPPFQFRSSDEVDRLVRAFETSSLSPSEWTHAAHVAVALRYALWYDHDEAVERLRAGIRRLNAANAVLQTPTSGFHETLTRFYAWAVRRHLRELGVQMSLLQIVNSTVATLWDRELPLTYYSRERLMSGPARTSWVEPDLRPLD